MTELELRKKAFVLGVEIERNLLLSKPFKNPAIVAALKNNKTMLFYWLNKQKELFAKDETYVAALFYETIQTASIINQYDTLSAIIADDELFSILKNIYAKLDDVKSIQLCSSALRRVGDENLEVRVKELRKTLSARKKEMGTLPKKEKT